MKKALKYFVLAIMLIPCALVFTACGSKAMSDRDFAHYIYKGYSAHQETEAYETYKDFELTLNMEQKTTMKSQLQYKETAAGELKTEMVDVPTNVNTKIVVSRKGKGKDTVLQITINKATSTTTQTVKEADQTLSGGNTITTTEEVKTYLFGMNKVEEVEKYYVLVDSSKVTKTSVDGAEPTESGKEASKTGENFATEAEFKSKVEEAVTLINQNYFYGNYTKVAPGAAEQLVSVYSYEKNGKDVIAKAEQSMFASMGGTATYSDGTSSITFRNGQLTKIAENSYVEMYEQMKAEMSTSLTIVYTSNASMMTEASITESEYQLTGVNYDLSRDLSVGGIFDSVSGGMGN